MYDLVPPLGGGKEKVLSKYLYGSEENTKGKVYAAYGRAIPKEWVPREMPQSLKNYGGSRLMPWFTPRQQKSIFIRVESMLVRGLQVPVVDLERSSMEAGSIFYPAHVYITDARNQQSVR